VSDDLRRLWADDPEAVRAAGRELAALGRLLAEGRIDEAIARAEAAGALYPEWAELDGAITALDDETAARKRAEAVREISLRIAGALLRAAAHQVVGL